MASDDIVEHRPAVCTGCERPLSGEAAATLRERRQVQDLPAVRLQVSEHQALHVRCQPVPRSVTACFR